MIFYFETRLWWERLNYKPMERKILSRLKVTKSDRVSQSFVKLRMGTGEHIYGLLLFTSFARRLGFCLCYWFGLLLKGRKSRLLPLSSAVILVSIRGFGILKAILQAMCSKVETTIEAGVAGIGAKKSRCRWYAGGEREKEYFSMFVGLEEREMCNILCLVVT